MRHTAGSRSHDGKNWFRNASVYQIYPRSFQDSNGDGVGDLRGIIRRLDWIAGLGVDAVWLCPVYASPQDDNGYDVSDYRAIHSEFGTMDDFDELLEELHRHGLKLIMDMVLNHTSDEHAWFLESRSSKNGPKRGWYHWHPGQGGSPPNAWSSWFSGSAWELDRNTGEYYLHLFSRKQPDLNWENGAMRAEIYSMLRWWLEKGVDGFRLDVINFISKTPLYPEGPRVPGSPYTDPYPFVSDGPHLHEFLSEMNREVFEPYGAVTVGETPGVNIETARLITGEGRGELDMVFQFELVELDSGPRGKWDIQPLSPEKVVGTMRRWQEGLRDEGWNSLYWNNHDQPRLISRFGGPGEARELSGKMLAAFHYLQKGTAFVYQGEEIGMINCPFESPDELRDLESVNFLAEADRTGRFGRDEAWAAVRAKGRDNARTPFCWNSGMNAGFTEGTPWLRVHPAYAGINAEESASRSDSLLSFYRDLLKFRHGETLVAEGDIEFSDEPGTALFLYRRFHRNAHGKSLWVGGVFGNGTVVSGRTKGSASAVLRNYPEIPDPGTWRPWELRVWYG